MKERQAPGVTPNKDLWEFCEGIAEKHDISPLNVLTRLVRIGRCVVQAQEKGGEALIRISGKEIEIKSLNKRIS